MTASMAAVVMTCDRRWRPHRFVGHGGADTFIINASQRGSVIRDFQDVGDKVQLDFGDWNQQRALGIAMSIEGNDFVYSANGEAIVTIKGAMNQFPKGTCVWSAEVGKSPDATAGSLMLEPAGRLRLKMKAIQDPPLGRQGRMCGSDVTPGRTLTQHKPVSNGGFLLLPIWGTKPAE